MGLIRRATAGLVTLVVLAVPSESLALKLTPPGKSGTDQYFETIPTSAGNAAPPPGNTGGGSAAVARLGQGRVGVARLSRMGKDGQAAASLAAATAPSNLDGNAGLSRKAGNSAPGSATNLTPPGDSAPGAIARAITGSDSGGLGLALPLLLVTCLIAAGGLFARKLRHGSGHSELPA